MNQQNEQIFLKDLTRIERTLQDQLLYKKQKENLNIRNIQQIENLYMDLKNKQFQIKILSNCYAQSRKQLNSLKRQKSHSKKLQRISFDNKNTQKYYSKTGFDFLYKQNRQSVHSISTFKRNQKNNNQNHSLFCNKQRLKKYHNKKIQTIYKKKILNYKNLQKLIQEFIKKQRKIKNIQTQEKYSLKNFLFYCTHQGIDMQGFDLELQKYIQIYLDMNIKREFQKVVKSCINQYINYDECQQLAYKILQKKYSIQDKEKTKQKNEHFQLYNLDFSKIKDKKDYKGFHQEFLEMAPFFSTSWRNEIKKLKKWQL